MKAKWNRESKAKAMTEYEVTEMAMRIQQKTINENAKRYDMILAYVLHEEFGFGKERIMRFLRGIIDAHIYTLDRYEQKYQDEGYRQTLLRNGIDIDIIEQELDAYAKKKGINI